MSVHKKGRKVVVTASMLKDWKSGVTIVCRRCGNVDIVNEGSLCDLWHLCKDCAKQDIENGRLKVVHP